MVNARWAERHSWQRRVRYNMLKQDITHVTSGWFCDYHEQACVTNVEKDRPFTMKAFLPSKLLEPDRLTDNIATMFLEELLDPSESTIIVANTPRPGPKYCALVVVYIIKERATYVCACGSINVMAPSGLTRPCKSTSTQVRLLSTTLW